MVEEDLGPVDLNNFNNIMNDSSTIYRNEFSIDNDVFYDYDNNDTIKTNKNSNNITNSLDTNMNMNNNMDTDIELSVKFNNIYQSIKDLVVKYINKLDEITEKKNKIITVIDEISKNKKLYFRDHIDNLNFQIEILANEKKYLYTLVHSFLLKYLKDLNSNGKHIIFLLTSLLNYNIKENKNEILTKIKKIEDITDDIKTKTLEDVLKDIEVVILNTNHNLELINNFNQEYSEYIENLQEKFKKDNLHCNNLQTTYNYKKKQFDLECEKYINTLDNVHLYFMNMSNYLSKQLDSAYVCKFCLTD